MLEDLKRQIRYEPETGKLFWLVSKKGVTKGRQVSPTPTTDGYMQCVFNSEHYYQHVLIWFYMTGTWPKETIDHINRIRSDNRWENLREATYSQNLYNSPCLYNKTGFKNITEHPWGWSVTSRIGTGKITNFGTYKTLDEAVEVAKKIREEYHGEFANHG